MSLTLYIVRAVYFVGALQLFGLLQFGLWFTPVPRRWAWILAAMTLLALLLWLPIETAAMSGDEPTFRTIGIVLRKTRFGELWLGRAVLLIALCAILRWRLVAMVLAGIVLVLTAASGHGGAEGNAAQLAADSVHLLSVGAWLGGLIPFAVAMRRPDAGTVAWRFSAIGTVCVGLILLTGGVNSWFLVGNLPALAGTDYGRLLLVKIALFVAMVAVAAVNRYRLTPRGDVAALRRNALIEAALGVAIVAIVAVLGTLPPAYYVGAG